MLGISFYLIRGIIIIVFGLLYCLFIMERKERIRKQELKDKRKQKQVFGLGDNNE